MTIPYELARRRKVASELLKQALTPGLSDQARAALELYAARLRAFEKVELATSELSILTAEHTAEDWQSLHSVLRNAAMKIKR